MLPFQRPLTAIIERQVQLLRHLAERHQAGRRVLELDAFEEAVRQAGRLYRNVAVLPTAEARYPRRALGSASVNGTDSSDGGG